MNTFRDSRLLLGFVLMVAGIFIGSMFYSAQKSYGSVETGEEYTATTTYAAHAFNERTLKSGGGSFGSVVITGDNTGFITLYNATTSNVNLRTGQKATSTILIADFPASSPEGTYTFDASFTDGLLLVTSGAEATSTITYK